MKLIIEIPDAMYENAVNDLMCGNFADRIKQGKVLPKNHGRLIDADALLSKAKFLYKGYEIALTNSIGDAPTIIEADKEETE